MKKNFFNIILCVFMLLAFTACGPINMEETLPEKPQVPTVPAEPAEVTATVTIIITEAASRTVLPTALVRANSYDITLTSKTDRNNTYTATVSDNGTAAVTATFTNVAIGEYTVEVSAFIRNSGANDVLLYTGSSELTVNINGENKAAVQLNALSSGENLKGSINLTIDWTEEASKDGVVRDAVLNNSVKVRFHFAEDYTANGYNPDYMVKEEKTILAGTTKAVFTTSDLPVTGKGIGYFSVTYEVEGVEYLLFNIGSEVFQIYSGQVSVPDDPNLYVVKSDNVPAEVNAIRVTLGYGEDPTKDLKVTWTESEGNVQLYNSVTLSLYDITSGRQLMNTVVINANETRATAEHTFDHELQIGHIYIVEAFARTPYGRQTKTFISSPFQPKVLVTGVDINENTIPAGYMTNGQSFTLSANVSPANATIKNLNWSFTNDGMFDVIANDDVSNTVTLIAKRPGQTTITATSADDASKFDTAVKTVSVKLAKPATPEIEVVPVDGGKTIRVTWAVTDSWAEAYEVYRVVNGVKEAKPVATVETSGSLDSVYVDSNIYTSTSYAYQVKAISNSLKTDSFDPSSELSDVSAATTPVNPTITLIQPTIQNYQLQINKGTGAASDILVTATQSQTLTIPAAIEGIRSYTWLVNNRMIKTSTNFEAVKSIELTASMDAVQIRGGDANVLTLICEDASGRAYSASINFRVVTVADTGVTIINPINDYIAIGEKTYQMYAYVVPENATMQGITYTSSNPAVAEVSNTGLITLKAIGNVTITAKPSYGEAATMTFDVYNPITDATTLVRIMNDAIKTPLQNVNSKIKFTYNAGDWWTADQQVETSDDGTIKAASNTGAKQNTNGYIKIKNLVKNNSEFGSFKFNTDPDLKVYAYDDGWGNLGTDLLRYIGYGNIGTVKVTLPYGQGNATVQFNNINVIEKNGTYTVTMPNTSAVTVNYAEVAEANPIF